MTEEEEGEEEQTDQHTAVETSDYKTM